uniref:heparosan-N-sulfate-glucuronate 5-epimerase n=1 Tax=Culicoides sonorensis TaxID=179676 RepID=A0A336LG24_CULSO
MLFFRTSPLRLFMICGFTAIFILTVTFWINCSDYAFTLPSSASLSSSSSGSFGNAGESERYKQSNNGEIVPFEDIECNINAEYVIACKKQGSEVYLPFSFIQKYFEVYGYVSNAPGSVRFEWSHSHGKINKPRGVYNPRGIFMYFDNYNVEMRDRVKCISGIDGVPISTQWSADGYFYATQIAQFGLSHYSKNFTDQEPRKRVLENGDDERGPWTSNNDQNKISVIYYPDKYSNCVNFSTIPSSTINESPESSSISITNLNHTLDLVLSIDLLVFSRTSSTFSTSSDKKRTKANTLITVRLQHSHTPEKIYNLTYVCGSDVLIQADKDNIRYGLGSKGIGTWRHIVRDLFIDLQKGLQFQSNGEKRKKIRRNELRILEISLSGHGIFDNLTLATSDHMAHFFDAAEWLVNNQNKTSGGWPIPVRRKLGSGFMELSSGWYSAMAQGHAISLLARAYHARGSRKYLKAAVNALKLFKIPSYQGGIQAKFLGKYVWYEEYPTQPASYVLNGFIYSLLGLYDLTAIAPMNYSTDAGQLFDNGMIALKKMLTLYDTGSGSTYDLRHFSLGIAPNLARWDYHATHVNQLLLLATIDKDPVIKTTAERWKDYMRGIRAQHN